MRPAGRRSASWQFARGCWRVMRSSARASANALEAKSGRVVYEDLLDGHVVGPGPVLGPAPELHQGVSGLVVAGVDAGDSGVVIYGDLRLCVTHHQRARPRPQPHTHSRLTPSRSHQPQCPEQTRGVPRRLRHSRRSQPLHRAAHSSSRHRPTQDPCRHIPARTTRSPHPPHRATVRRPPQARQHPAATRARGLRQDRTAPSPGGVIPPGRRRWTRRRPDRIHRHPAAHLSVWAHARK